MNRHIRELYLGSNNLGAEGAKASNDCRFGDVWGKLRIHHVTGLGKSPQKQSQLEDCEPRCQRHGE